MADRAGTIGEVLRLALVEDALHAAFRLAPMRVRPPWQLLHVAAERRARRCSAVPSPEFASPLLREGEFVLDRLYAGNAARHLGGLGAGADGRHLTGQCDDTGIGADIHLLELRILAEAGLDGLRDVLIVDIHRLSGRRP